MCGDESVSVVMCMCMSMCVYPYAHASHMSMCVSVHTYCVSSIDIHVGVRCIDVPSVQSLEHWDAYLMHVSLLYVQSGAW